MQKKVGEFYDILEDMLNMYVDKSEEEKMLVVMDVISHFTSIFGK